MSAQPAVVVSNVSKRYGGRRALDGVSVTVNAGEIIGFLGPNGAGKTTLVEILVGLRAADSGDVQILQQAMPSGLSSIRNRLGVATQNGALSENVTVREIVSLYASLYAHTRPVDQVIASAGLQNHSNNRYRTLSGGQKQRLAIALALIGDPDVVFLDEPTSGLDPQARRDVWRSLLHGPERSRRAVLLTTQQMDEAAALCDRIYILFAGRIVASGTAVELIEQHAPQPRIVFHTKGHAAEEALKDFELQVTPTTLDGRRIVVLEQSPMEAMARLLERRASASFDLTQLTIEAGTLDDVFVTLAKKFHGGAK